MAVRDDVVVVEQRPHHTGLRILLGLIVLAVLVAVIVLIVLGYGTGFWQFPPA